MRYAVKRIRHISLTTADLAALAVFYERCFGCRRLQQAHRSGAQFERLLQVQGGAQSLMLGLGEQTIELLQFERPGRSYPQSSSAAELIFQHFAIVVADMQRALRHLETIDGWSPISTQGAEQLPASSGGVKAYKFRDPEGHPLELLAFPAPEACGESSNKPLYLGIDHSAISVSDTASSVSFYQGLGLSVSGCSLNSGIEQQRLDGLIEPHVEVTAMMPQQATMPHLELLCYRGVAQPDKLALCSNDIAATRLVLEVDTTACDPSDALPHRLVDPDGHQLLMCGV